MLIYMYHYIFSLLDVHVMLFYSHATLHVSVYISLICVHIMLFYSHATLHVSLYI